MRFGALLLWLLLLGPLAPFSFGQLSQPQTYTVRGTVVNSVTGVPIRGALVQIYSGRPRSRLTGPQGEFVFEGVPPGTFGARIQKPGFFSPQELPVPGARQVMITAGPDQPPVVLKLIPEGVIFGHVAGGNGELIESLPVQLLFERMDNGKKTRSFMHRVNTDEQGEFRVAELQPGRYFVFLGPSSLPSSYPAAKVSQPGVRGYPAVFYPGVPDSASAAPIEITPGKHFEINLTLSSQPFYRISGTVSGNLPDRGISLQIVDAAGQPISSGFQFDPSRGTFRTQWLPAGQCTLTAQMHDPATQQSYFASQSVNLTSDLTGVHLVLLPNASIPVTFHMETTQNASPSEQTVLFTSGSDRSRREQARIPANLVLTSQSQPLMRRQYYSELAPGDESSFVVRNIPPGVYFVEVQHHGPYYAQSVRSGTLNLLEQPLTVAPGAALQPIEVVLRDDFATLEGNVFFEGDDIPAQLIAIPEDAPQQVRPFNLGQLVPTPGQARPSTRFEMPQLRPGNYKLLAVDDPSFEYADPEVLQKYVSKAQEAFLAPGQRTKVSLDLVHIGD